MCNRLPYRAIIVNLPASGTRPSRSGLQRSQFQQAPCGTGVLCRALLETIIS
jgi:hypothetical protein